MTQILSFLLQPRILTLIGTAIATLLAKWGLHADPATIAGVVGSGLAVYLGESHVAHGEAVGAGPKP